MSYSNKTHVILIKDENGDWQVRTENICLVKDDDPTNTCFVYFKKEFDSENKKSKLYQYSKDRVVVLDKPAVLNPCEYIVFHNGEQQENLYAVCHFDRNPNFNYWALAFQDSRPDVVCKDEEISIVPSSTVPATKSKDVLKYLTQMAYLHHYDIRFGDEKKVLLGEQYEHLRRGDMAPLLEAFLIPDRFENTKDKVCKIPIYPFCSNSSQIKAVNRALSKRISVIQGPPGTGKTETILNILMNLVVNGKTAMVVAGSNSATDNILDKLKEEGLDFLIARLGRKSNKESFVKKQLILILMIQIQHYLKN